MQPYKEHVPCGEPEIVPENAEKMKERIKQLMDVGADEVKIFELSDKQLNELLKKETGINREERRKRVKSYRKTGKFV
jgi:hypothetical protein